MNIYESYEDDEEEEEPCQCIPCALQRFAWVEEVFVAANPVSQRKAEHLVFLTHSYPEGVDITPNVLAYIEALKPKRDDLVLTIYDVDPGCRSVFNTSRKQTAELRKLFSERGQPKPPGRISHRSGFFHQKGGPQKATRFGS